MYVVVYFLHCSRFLLIHVDFSYFSFCVSVGIFIIADSYASLGGAVYQQLQMFVIIIIIIIIMIVIVIVIVTVIVITKITIIINIENQTKVNKIKKIVRKE